MKKDMDMNTQVSMTKGKVIGGIVGIVVVMFFVGYYFGNMHGSANAQMTRGMGQGQYAGHGMGGGSRFSNGGIAAGTILSQDSTGITLKLQNGGSKIVIFGASTSVLKSVAGALTDLSVGQNVTVMGTANPDGSITAASVQIRPAMQQPQGGAQGAPMMPATGAAPAGN